MMSSCRTTISTPSRPATALGWLRRRRTLGAVVLLLQTGCYTYAPVMGGQPAPGNRVSLAISDQGRVALGSQVGAGALKIEGTLVGVENGEYVLRVHEINTIDGGTSHWSGERLVVQRDHVSTVALRRFSKGRTIVAVAAVAAALGIAIFGQDLFGGASPGRPGQGGEPSEQ